MNESEVYSTGSVIIFTDSGNQHKSDNIKICLIVDNVSPEQHIVPEEYIAKELAGFNKKQGYIAHRKQAKNAKQMNKLVSKLVDKYPKGTPMTNWSWGERMSAASEWHYVRYEIE